MISNDIALGIFFLSQTAFGALGNSFLLGLYIITLLTGSRIRPIDMVLFQLAFVNNLMLLSKGIPQTMAAFGLKNFLEDVGCKLVFYVHRVARCLSLSITCLLSTLQAIIITPRSSRWTQLKDKILKYIVAFSLSWWTFHLLANLLILIYIKGPKRSKNITEIKNFIYCSDSFHGSPNIALYVFIISLPDVVCVGIMVWTSGYIVLILYRHHKRIQYIRGQNLMSTGSPEDKATQTVLLLVSMFVSFYSLNSVLAASIHFWEQTSWLIHTSVFLAACFPSCSPFVLIISDSQVLKYYLALRRKMGKDKTPILKQY
ncbi:vomeronasal type-1 receptor 1-like [Gracilinanus agilis]|uniref:vomeronasal type-1 receptor 1-like n=1 Tax=Gracilinanus agilis TaxID=191870 RepID=UPI001CFC9E95|nr:vomeronasal type-1 receptor 1-like [Gracilinanus agilis]